MRSFPPAGTWASILACMYEGVTDKVEDRTFEQDVIEDIWDGNDKGIREI